MEQQYSYQKQLRPLVLLRYSIGIIYIWFGALKFFHGYSPAEQLATNTIGKLTFGLVPENVSILLLATWEFVLGLAFLYGRWMKTLLVFLFVHLACTFTPLLFFPGESFKHAPYGFTLVGQYIMKNLILVSAGMVLWQYSPPKK